jgi:hypothetical protein
MLNNRLTPSFSLRPNLYTCWAAGCNWEHPEKEEIELCPEYKKRWNATRARIQQDLIEEYQFNFFRDIHNYDRKGI